MQVGSDSRARETVPQGAGGSGTRRLPDPVAIIGVFALGCFFWIRNNAGMAVFAALLFGDSLPFSTICLALIYRAFDPMRSREVHVASAPGEAPPPHLNPSWFLWPMLVAGAAVKLLTVGSLLLFGGGGMYVAFLLSLFVLLPVYVLVTLALLVQWIDRRIAEGGWLVAFRRSLSCGAIYTGAFLTGIGLASVGAIMDRAAGKPLGAGHNVHGVAVLAISLIGGVAVVTGVSTGVTLALRPGDVPRPSRAGFAVKGSYAYSALLIGADCIAYQMISRAYLPLQAFVLVVLAVCVSGMAIAEVATSPAYLRRGS